MTKGSDQVYDLNLSLGEDCFRWRKKSPFNAEAQDTFRIKVVWRRMEIWQRVPHVLYGEMHELIKEHAIYFQTLLLLSIALDYLALLLILFR